MTTTVAYSTGKLYRIRWAGFSVVVAAGSLESARETFSVWVKDRHGFIVQPSHVHSAKQTNGINSGDVLLISQPTLEA